MCVIDLKNLTHLIRKPGYLGTLLKYETVNDVFLDTVHRFYQGVIHFQNIILFPDPRVNVISFTPIRKVRSACDYFHDSRIA